MRALAVGVVRPVQALQLSKAQLHGLEPAQTKDVPNELRFEGFDVGGCTVERTERVGSDKRGVTLLADKVDVAVSGRPSTSPDDAVEVMKELDSKGSEAFAKKLGSPPKTSREPSGY